MRRAVRILLWQFVMLAGTLPALGGQEGHGGHGVWEGGRLFVLDLVERHLHESAFFPKVPISPKILGIVRESALAKEGGLDTALISMKLSEIEQVSPLSSRLILAALESFRWRFTDQALASIGDRGLSYVDDRKPQAVQLAVRNGLGVDIDRGLWAKLDQPNKVALVLHEILYSFQWSNAERLLQQSCEKKIPLLQPERSQDGPSVTREWVGKVDACREAKPLDSGGARAAVAFLLSPDFLTWKYVPPTASFRYDPFPGILPMDDTGNYRFDLGNGFATTGDLAYVFTLQASEGRLEFVAPETTSDEDLRKMAKDRCSQFYEMASWGAAAQVTATFGASGGSSVSFGPPDRLIETGIGWEYPIPTSLTEGTRLAKFDRVSIKDSSMTDPFLCIRTIVDLFARMRSRLPPR